METKYIENIGNSIASLRNNEMPCEVLLLEIGTLEINNIDELQGILKILSLILDYDYRNNNIIIKDLEVNS